MGRETVLLHLQTNRFYELNRTGARLWQLLAQGCSREALHQRLTEEFDVPPDQLSREIDAILTSLVAEQLVSCNAGQ